MKNEPRSAEASSITADVHADHDAKVIAGQKKALELALHGAPLRVVLAVIVETIEAQSVNGVLGSILLLDAQAGRLRHGAAPSLPAAYNEAIDGIAIGPTVGSCGTAAFTGKTVVVSDLASDPLWADFKDLALSHGLRACWSTPILSSQGAVLGTFALYHRTPAVPAARDREIVELLGHTAALVIEREQQVYQREAVEAELRATQDAQLLRIQTMFEHAPAAIAVVRGPQYVFEVANPKYRELVGHRPLIGRSMREAFPELADQNLGDPLSEVYATGEANVGRSVRAALVRTPGGAPEEGFFDFVHQPLFDADGRVESILIVAFEVTALERAKAEAEAARARAEASELGLRTFIDNLPELAWTARPDGYIDYYNRRWYEYTGTTFEEMQGWGWERLHDPTLLPKVVERWNHSLRTGEPFEMEFTLRGKDGIPRWFLTRVAPMRDASGAIVRWFGTNTNIHEIKAAQALSTAMAEQSRETEQILLEMRAAKEHAERRLAALEAERSSQS